MNSIFSQLEVNEQQYYNNLRVRYVMTRTSFRSARKNSHCRLSEFYGNWSSLTILEINLIRCNLFN